MKVETVLVKSERVQGKSCYHELYIKKKKKKKIRKEKKRRTYTCTKREKLTELI